MRYDEDDDLNGKVGDVQVETTPLPDGDQQVHILIRISIPVVIGFILLCAAVVFYVIR